MLKRKEEAEELFSVEIDDCPFHIFYCSAIADLYEKGEDNPSKMIVIWSEEDKSFSFVQIGHEIFVPEDFTVVLENLKKGLLNENTKDNSSN